jgi:hypothetical protein
MSLSNYSHQALLNYMFGNTSNFDIQPSVYIGMGTADATAGDGTGFVEASAGGYARQLEGAASWNAATLADPSVIDNGVAITFPQASADWSSGSNQIYAVIYDAVTAGNYLGGGGHTVDKPVLNGDTAQYAVGDYDVQFDWTG